MAKRKIFDELMEGVDAMKKHREGKLTLRSDKEEVTSLPAVDRMCPNQIDKTPRR